MVDTAGLPVGMIDEDRPVRNLSPHDGDMATGHAGRGAENQHLSGAGLMGMSVAPRGLPPP